MSNYKKIFVAFVAMMTVFGVVGFVPSGASAAAMDGDLIKMPGNPAVYYYKGGKRYVFPNEKTYKTWYKDFSSVKTISQDELQSYPLGGNVTYRPGTRLVKITTDPKVYAVEPGGVLRHISSESIAVALYGANWNKMIDDVPDPFFVNYTTGSPITSNVHPTGTVIKRGSQYYYIDNGNERPFASEAALAANMINTAFAVETTMDYPDGSSITGKEDALVNVAGSASTSSTSAAGLTVSAGAMMASTSLPKGAMGVRVGSWNFTAGPEGAVTLSSVTFKRTGVGTTTDISSFYIYDGVNRLTSGRTFNTSTNEVTVTLNITIPAGSTKVLTGVMNIATGANSGDEHVIGIESATKISSNATSVNGVFPINSNKHSIAGASAGTLTIEKNGSLNAARVGDKGAKVSEFKLSASTEDAYVTQVTLTQGGNISNSALSNFVLKQSGTTVATASAIASNDRLDLVFSPAFKIEKGNNRVFELYADIAGRPNDTYGFYVEDTADVLATGGTYGVGMTVSINGNFDAFSDTGISQTLQGGAFTVSFDGPASANISNSASDVIIWKGTVYSANEVEVRNWRFGIQDLTATGAGLCEVGSCHVQDVKLWNLNNNTVIAGPFEFTPAANLGEAAVAYFTFTDDYVFAAGSTTQIGLSVDIRETPASGVLSLQARMGDGTNSFTANDIKNIGSNTYLTLGTDITPSSEIVGNTQTVVAGGLTVATAPSPTDNNMIRGASNFTSVAFNFTAGSGSSVKVNSIQVTGGLDDGDDFDYNDAGVTLNNLVLTAKLMDGTTQVGTTKSFVSGVATFDNLNWTIPASQTKKLDVVITTNSAYSLGSSNDDRLRFSLEASSVTAVDANGNTISTINGLPANSADTAADTITTVKSSGSLTVSLAPTPTNPPSGLHAAGATDKTLAAFKFEAIDDSFNVRKFTLVPLVSGSVSDASNDRIATLKIKYPTQSSGVQTRTVGLSGTANLVDISDMPMYVPQNGSATLEVLADLATFTLLDGTEAENIAFGIDADNSSSNNQATGVASNQDDNTWGSDVNGNQQNVYRTVLTVAAGFGTPNNTTRTRQAGQKVFSVNLSATSGSNAFIRGSKKAADSSAASWAVMGTGPTVATSTAQKVSGTNSILFTEDATAGLNDGVYYDFGSTTALDNYSRVSFYIYSSVNIAAGDIKFFTNDTGDLTIPIDNVSIGAVTAANGWTHVSLTVAPTGAQYAGLYIADNTATYNNATIYIDDLRFYNDSINLDVAGSLGATGTVNGLVFSLKDSSGTVRAFGAFSGTGGNSGSGTVLLVAGDAADTASTATYSDIEISSTTLALDVETNTVTLVGDQGSIADNLSVSTDTGTVSSAGDWRWYDNSDSAGGNNMASITVVNPTSTTIAFSNSY